MAALVDMLKVFMGLALVAEEPVAIQEMAVLVAPRNIITFTELLAQGAAEVAQGLPHYIMLTHMTGNGAGLVGEA